MSLTGIKPSRIALLLVMVAMGLHIGLRRVWPVYRLPYLGIALFVGGFWLMASSGNLFRKHGTPVAAEQGVSKLVTEGPYRFSRNPIYLGIALMLLGIACMDGTPPFYAISPLFLLAMDLTYVRLEEKMLESKFGSEYKQYQKSVRRWV